MASERKSGMEVKEGPFWRERGTPVLMGLTHEVVYPRSGSRVGRVGRPGLALLAFLAIKPLPALGPYAIRATARKKGGPNVAPALSPRPGSHSVRPVLCMVGANRLAPSAGGGRLHVVATHKTSRCQAI